MCFDNLIGLKSCNTSTPTSGLYVEDLGITANECDNYINSEYANGEALIQSKIDFASKLIKAQVANHFSSEIKTKSLIDSATVGFYQDNLQNKSGITDSLGGISLTLLNNQSYQNIYINNISLLLDYTGDVEVFIINLLTGETLDTYTLSCEANKIATKQINKSYQSNKQKLDLFIGYNTTSINSINSNIGYVECPSCSGYRLSNSYTYYSSCSLDVNSNKTRDKLVNNSHTFGLSINYSVQCSIDKWVCEISNLLALPLLYKTGIEIMQYSLMASNRVNSRQTIDYERNQKRLDLWNVEYNNSLAASLQKIVIPKDDCFYCYSKQQTKVILP